MKPGDVVLAYNPQADAKLKSRPSIVLKVIPPFGDLLVCGISTRSHNYAPELDELITRTDEDYVLSGLEQDSLIRLGYLTTHPTQHLGKRIGSISKSRLNQLLERLSKFLTPSN